MSVNVIGKSCLALQQLECVQKTFNIKALPQGCLILLCVCSQVLVPLESKWTDWPTFINSEFSFLSLVTGLSRTHFLARGDRPEASPSKTHLESTNCKHTLCALHSEASWRHLQSRAPQKKRRGQTHVFSCFRDETLSEDLASRRKTENLQCRMRSSPTVNPQINFQNLFINEQV